MMNTSYLGWWKGAGSRQWFLCPKGDCGIEEKGSIHGVIDKKQQYWPKYINGEAIIQHFQDKDDIPDIYYKFGVGIVATTESLLSGLMQKHYFHKKILMFFYFFKKLEQQTLYLECWMIYLFMYTA